MRRVFTLLRPSTLTVVQVDEETVIRALDAWLDQGELSEGEIEALVDPDIFPVSCETCKHVWMRCEYLGVGLGDGTCDSCLTGLPNWEPLGS